MVNPAWIIRKRRMVAWAKAHGVSVPKGLRVAAPTCGPACVALIRAIETKAFGPLSVTGKWSERMARLVAPAKSVRERAVSVAVTQIGVKEQPADSNDGPKVREYQATTGAYRAPWCASFVTWCFKQAGKRLDGFNTAYVPSWRDAARAGRNGLTVVSKADAGPGDCALFDWGGDGTPDHIGFLTSPVDASGAFHTIEGNTSFGNDSNGGEVMRRDRNAAQVLVFVRVVG